MFELKSLIQLKKQIGTKCKVDGCDNIISAFNGSGSKTLCRKHQKDLIKNGGYSRPDRKYSFHKKDKCDECGYDPWQDPRMPKNIPKEVQSIIARSMLHCDHKIRRADGGDDSESNIRTLCCFCHIKKTSINKDYNKSKKNY